MDERFSCTEDAVEHIIRICNVIVDKARVVFPNSSITDIPGYVLEFCRKVLMQAATLVKVAREEKDYNTVCSLVRILADNMAILQVVYNCQKEEEKILRHFLYVLDGVSQRYEYLKDCRMSYDGRIPKETFVALMRQVQGAKNNAVDCIKMCDDAIKKLPIYAAHNNEIDALIRKRNWKFKQVDPFHEKDKNAYSWKEMYGMLEIRDISNIMSYFSQYVHGLSISNIGLGDPDDFDAPLSFSFCLLGWLYNYLNKEYVPHIGEYTMEDIDKMAPGLIDAIIARKIKNEAQWAGEFR